MVMADLDSSLRDRCTGVRWIEPATRALHFPHHSDRPGTKHAHRAVRIRGGFVSRVTLRCADQHAQQEVIRLGGDARMRTLAGAGHVEHANVMGFQPASDVRCVRILPQVHHEAWFGVMNGQAVSQVRATVNRPRQSIRVASESSTFLRVRMEYLAERVARNWYCAGIGHLQPTAPRHQPPWGTPAAMARRARHGQRPSAPGNNAAEPCCAGAGPMDLNHRAQLGYYGHE